MIIGTPGLWVKRNLLEIPDPVFRTANDCKKGDSYIMKSLAIALVLATSSCFAAEVDGSWTGTLRGSTGDFSITLTLKAEGTKLTGKSIGPVGEKLHREWEGRRG